MNEPVLYLVGTPIGNLGDLSPRCKEILETVDFIAAEDTRNTLKLLNYLGIKKPMLSYFEHNKRERGMEILSRIREGKTFMIPGLIQTGKAQGMRLMDDSLQQLYLAGTISAEECLGRATDHVMMEKFLKEHPETAPAQA